MEGYSVTVAAETRLFLMSVLLGLPLGLLLDAFRLMRALLPHPRLVVLLEDLVYAFAFVFLLECSAMTLAGGALRYYYALGAALGLLLYLMTIGAVTGRLMRQIRRTRRTVLGRMRRGVERITKKIRFLFMKHHKNVHSTKKLSERA